MSPISTHKTRYEILLDKNICELISYAIVAHSLKHICIYMLTPMLKTQMFCFCAVFGALLFPLANAFCCWKHILSLKYIRWLKRWYEANPMIFWYIEIYRMFSYGGLTICKNFPKKYNVIKKNPNNDDKKRPCW